MKTVDFSDIITVYDLKVYRCRQLIELMKVCVLKVYIISCFYIYKNLIWLFSETA